MKIIKLWIHWISVIRLRMSYSVAFDSGERKSTSYGGLHRVKVQRSSTPGYVWWLTAARQPSVQQGVRIRATQSSRPHATHGWQGHHEWTAWQVKGAICTCCVSFKRIQFTVKPVLSDMHWERKLCRNRQCRITLGKTHRKCMVIWEW